MSGPTIIIKSVLGVNPHMALFEDCRTREDIVTDHVSLDTPTVILGPSVEDLISITKYCISDRGVLSEQLVKIVVSESVHDFVTDSIVTQAYLMELVQNQYIAYRVLPDADSRVISTEKFGISLETDKGLGFSLEGDEQGATDLYEYCIAEYESANEILFDGNSPTSLYNIAEYSFDADFRGVFDQILVEFCELEGGLDDIHRAFVSYLMLAAAYHEYDLHNVDQYCSECDIKSSATISRIGTQLEDDSLIHAYTVEDQVGKCKKRLTLNDSYELDEMVGVFDIL